MLTPLFMKVFILHVPYQYRGGEDVHVDVLEAAYRQIGFEPILYPEDRRPPSHLLGKSLWSLLPSDDFEELDEAWVKHQPRYIHIHNVFPLFGPRLFRWAMKRQAPLVMTVHNHRIFCTNGLALRNGKVCKDCFDKKIPWKAVVHNCNGQLRKSIYHTMALSQMRLGGLYEKAVHRFIAPSPYIQSELIRIGIPEAKVNHILNPVRASVVPSDSDTAEVEKFDVFYAGRLSHEKGVRDLIGAAELLSHLKFGIAGDGPDEPFVEAAAARLKNVSYLGSLTHSNVLKLIDSARLTVLPSICNEILGSFVLESYYQGKPCVVTDLESLAWLAKGNFPGVLAKAGDSRDLARAIEEGLRHKKIDEKNHEMLQQYLGFDRFCADLSKMAKSLEIKTDLNLPALE